MIEKVFDRKQFGLFRLSPVLDLKSVTEKDKINRLELVIPVEDF